ncbi:MAG TPA: preprotein translocase subunit SecG [Planctomycetota bacterium]
MIQFLLYTVFSLSALVLTLIILLQEGKGGGLTDAFGSGGTETFGVRAGGINRFTFGVFAAFVLSAMAAHWTAKDADSGSLMQNQPGGIGAPINPGSGAGEGGGGN